MTARMLMIPAVATMTLLFCTSPASAQMGPCATQIGPDLPDLIMDANLLRTQMFVTEEQFNANSCTVVEGAVSKAGKQVLLRFNSSTPNVGAVDLHVGDPSQCLNTLFHLSECHQHLHFEDYTAYRLWTEAGYANWVAMRDAKAATNSGTNAQLLATAAANGELIVGRKQGFCMVDSARYPDAPVRGGEAKYLSCSSNQGISVGWEDVYAPQLPDQFIQITGLREGTYVLENQVNPNQLLPEAQYVNNYAAVKLYYTPRHGKTAGTVEIVP